MDTEDFRIARDVEAIFVRSLVDTSKINIDVINRSVYIDGWFHVFDASHRHQTDREGHEIQDSGTGTTTAKKLLLFIEQQIRGLRDVGSVQMKFQNWKKTGAGWTESA